METNTETLTKIPIENQPRVRYLMFTAIGLMLVGWLLNTPTGLLGKADAIGYAVCHQIAHRSFHIGDRPISLCASTRFQQYVCYLTVNCAPIKKAIP
ncbi:hypothetical protein ACFLYP_04105 [Chloroflexota bacterium]